jgi:hypothetical protein
MKIFNHLRTLAEIGCLMIILGETEVGHSNVDSPLPVDDPDLPTPASPRNPDNVPPESTARADIEAMNPLLKASVEANNGRQILKNRKFCLENHADVLLKGNKRESK